MTALIRFPFQMLTRDIVIAQSLQGLLRAGPEVLLQQSPARAAADGARPECRLCCSAMYSVSTRMQNMYHEHPM